MLSDLGVRSAIYRLRHPTGRLEFILVPMLHVGSRSFYAEVRRVAIPTLLMTCPCTSRRAALPVIRTRRPGTPAQGFAEVAS